jgi:hypothetical protein
VAHILRNLYRSMRPIRQWGPALFLAAPLAACLPPEASSIAIVSGNQQGAPLQHPLPEPLTVGVFDRTGAPVGGARVAWTVPVGGGKLEADTTTSLASGVSQVKFTVGAAPGTERIHASLVGTTESVTFSALAGQSQSPWPNDPAGFTTLTDWPYNQMVTRLDGGFSRGIEVWNQGAGTGFAAIVHDSGAPLSPPNVVQIVYPVGLPSGSAPWNLYYNVRGREYYTAFWWKANAEWQGDPSGINKITFWQDAAPSSGNLIVMLNNQRQPAYFLTVTLEFNHATNGHLANSLGAGSVWHVFGNVRGGNYAIVPGTWYRIELYFKGSTTPTSQDGVLRWWATKLGDAAPTQVGDYTNVNFDTANFIQFGFTPTWGGNSGVTKAHADYYWIDHVHLSRP